MNILALSTSGRAASAALIQNGSVLAHAVCDNGLTHSETIMPIIDSLFSSGAPFAFNETDAFAADIGPGSFTGVRIGVCIANAFGAASGKPIASISSLEALARAASEQQTVCTIIDARNSNCYGAIYQGKTPILSPSALTVAELLAQTPNGTLFTGDGASVYAEEIVQMHPEARFADMTLHMLTADMLGQISYETLSKGLGEKEIRPLYLRPSQAERLFKER